MIFRMILRRKCMSNARKHTVRRGYARCALSALCEFLIAEGKSASYKTYAENIPSCRLAESAVFLELGRRMTAVGVSIPTNVNEAY